MYIYTYSTIYVYVPTHISCEYIDKHIIAPHTNYLLNILQTTGGVGVAIFVLTRSGAQMIRIVKNKIKIVNSNRQVVAETGIL